MLGRIWGSLFATVLYVLASIAGLESAVAQQQVWAGNVSSLGRSIQAFNLRPRLRYYIVVSRNVYFGRWSVNGRSLLNDACYEYNAKGRPDSLPVFKNSFNIPVCDGRYRSSHVYRSAPFVYSGGALRFWIFDTDYRDNSGSMYVQVFRVGSGGPRPGVNAACNSYARTAISQHRDNLRRRCGGTGNRWQLNYQNHYGWCLRVGPGARRSETNARANRLRRCGTGPRPGVNAICNSYARSAISQHRDNLRRRCGGRGNRWQLNYQNHYGWCLRVGPGARRSETNARANRLRRCGAGPRPGVNAICNSYARTAISQQRTNLRRRCGGRGARWQLNYQNHYRWCLRVGASNRRYETTQRSNFLRRCR